MTQTGDSIAEAMQADQVTDEPIAPDAGKDDEAAITAAGRAPKPIVDRYRQPSGGYRLILLGVLLVAAAAALAWIAREQLGESVLLAAMGALAGVGVFFLFVLSLGFIQLTSSRRADEFSSNMINGMDSGVLVTDDDGRIIYANRAYGDITGLPSDIEITNLESMLARSPDASQVVYRLANQVRDGHSVSEEFRLANGLGAGDGGAGWFRIRARRMANPDSKGDFTVWQLSDITADRLSQETAFQDLQRAIHYLDHAPAGFFSSESDGAIAYLNATLADWLGIDLALFEPGSIHLKDFISDQGVALVEAVKPDDDRPRTAVIDVDFEQSGGGRMPVRLYHKVSHGGDGAPGAARTLVINRLAKEETDSALLDAELRFSRFFNNTPIAIAAVSDSGKTVRTNATFMRMFKDKIGESGRTEGIRLSSLVADSDRAQVDQAVEAALSGQAETRMVNATMAGNDSRFLRLFLSPVIDDTEGDSSGERVIVYALETTQQRALEEQFAKGQKMQAVGQLAGGVAHDFNNVLTAIIGFSDLLLTNHRPSDPSFQDIMNIKQNANRAASLVRQLLAFSRRQTLRPQVLQLGDVLSDLRMLLSRLLGEKVDLNVVHGRDLWPVKADLSQLEQVVVNLAVNARDAMPDGGELTISTANVNPEEVKKKYNYKEMPAADFVLLEVSDEGIGMGEEVLEKIFEPFFSTKEVGKGTGLGLSTVYGVIKQTGGFIYPESKEGEGTAFRVFLPRHIPTTEEEAPPAGKSGQEAARDLTGNATILLVEDEDAVRAFGSRALASRGYTVHEAAGGIEALEVLKKHGGDVDLIVSDVVMPEMDGPTLLGEVRKKWPDLKFVFVSGYAEEAFAKNLPKDELGRFGFLPKPFSLKQLATTVKEMLAE